MKVANHISILLLLVAFTLRCTEVWATSYTYTQGRGLDLSWTAEDRVGITTATITYGDMEQLRFQASSTALANRNERSLYAVGYQLKPNTAYYSYRPYQWQEVFDARQIVCDYAGQAQQGNANTAGLSPFDYAMAATTTTTTACTFDYQRIGGALRITFLAPRTASISSVSLLAEGQVIATTATMNLLDKSVVLGGLQSAVTLATSNISVSKGAKVTTYLMLPAQNLTATTLTVAMTDASGTITIATIRGMQIKAGKVYDIDLTDAELNTAKQSSINLQGFDVSRQATAIDYPLARMTDMPLDADYHVEYASWLKGDVNKDGEVDMVDAIALNGYYLNGMTAGLDAKICDMNDDGDIDVQDVIAIIGVYLNGK